MNTLHPFTRPSTAVPPRMRPEDVRLHRRERVVDAHAARLSSRHLVHCHNRGSEDHDMMSRFGIVKDGVFGGPDPFTHLAVLPPEAAPL